MARIPEDTIRTCVVCGKEFKPDSHLRKVCSFECREVFRKQQREVANRIRREARAKGKTIHVQRKLITVQAQRADNMKAIEEDALEAERLGVSYGYYSARRSMLDDM